jgi:hypothetical protein
LQLKNKRFKDVVVLSWSTSDESIEIQNENILLKQKNGNLMKVPAGVYYYDLQIIKDGITKTYLKGDLSIIRDVTEV